MTRGDWRRLRGREWTAELLGSEFRACCLLAAVPATLHGRQQLVKECSEKLERIDFDLRFEFIPLAQ